MTIQSKTPIEILKKELIKLLWGIVAATLAGLVFWFIALPVLKNQFQNLGRGNNVQPSQSIKTK